MKLHVTITAVLATLAAVSQPASAQDWAKARLEKSPRHLEWVKVKHGDREVNCFIAFPEVKEKATTVVVIHEIFGLSDWVRLLTVELAEAGYVAIAPDLLSGAAPGGGGSAEFGGGDNVRKAIGSLPPDQITADLKAVQDYVAKVPASNGKVTVGGFCWGGGQTFRFATNSPDIKAAFAFYGTGPDNGDDIKRINAPVFGFYAGNDARVNATIPKTAELMKKEEKVYEPVIYEGAGHGFMRAGDSPEAKEADKKARNDAWTRWMDLLKKL